MNWKNPAGKETPARLYIGDTLVATIKRRPTGDYPFYFSQKIILTYNGGFKTIQSAKRHAETRLKAFVNMVILPVVITESPSTEQPQPEQTTEQNLFENLFLYSTLFCGNIDKITSLKAAARFAAKQSSDELFKNRLLDYVNELIRQEEDKAKQHLNYFSQTLFDKTTPK